ncbi:hypothetical protein H8E07_06640 [bacterium]|nr:hypothetical protein [bacterium]
MKTFVARFRSMITGVLSGFDRLVFRGTLLPLYRPGGMFFFLEDAGVRLLDFKKYVQDTSEQVKDAALREARDGGRPTRYLRSSGTDKKELARKLLAENPTDQGIVCALYGVEPCTSFEYHRSADPKQRGLKLRPRKCLHVYQYRLHPVFGPMNVRIQTWFPFNIQICLNGRDWLAQQLVAAGCDDFLRYDNCFTRLGDLELAQRLAKDQLATDWPAALTAIARSINPLHDAIFEPSPMDYYWSAYQTEWATDVMFRDPAALAALYPALVKHATHHFASPDVMRFLGRKVHGGFNGELTGSFKRRPEGVRVKHWLAGNSIKMYDKGGSVLRVETTIAQPRGFKVLRPKQDEPDGKLDWRPLRKGVADLHRRAQVSQRANDSYLDALGVVDDSTLISEVLDQVARPARYRGRRVRAIRTGDPEDVALLAAISRGEFATAGFRNRDLRLLLHPQTATADPDQRRRVAARVGRRIRILRAHGLIKKIPKSHRYRLTPKGNLLTAAISATRNATVKQLLREAA